MSLPDEKDETRLLDPEIRRFVDAMTAAWASHGDLSQSSSVEMRRIAEKVREPWIRGGPEMAAVREHTIPAGARGVRVRSYDPGGAPEKPALVYLHGGGWTLFSLDTHDRVMREYAARAGVTVIGVDYALAPEAGYPIALDQVVTVARFLAARGSELGIDPSRIAIGGDSAGANLAIGAALRIRDEGDPSLIRAMVLAYGVFDRESTAAARDRFGGAGNMLTAGEMDAFWRNYLQSERDSDSPYVVPIKANVQGLPPAFFVVPECDLLTEQSLRMAERMKEAGVPIRLEIYPGATHSFLEAVSISALAGRAFAESASWLRTILGTAPLCEERA